MVILMRLTPIIPYNVFNYAMGVTSLSLRDFVFGSVGMIPNTAMNIYIGVNLDGLGDLIDGNYDLGPYTHVYIVIGVCVGIGMTLLVICLAKNELDKMIAEEKESN